MSKFLAGVLATVFAGLLLFVSQEWLRKEFITGEAQIEFFEFTPEFLTSAAAIRDWESKLKPLSSDVFDNAQRVAIQPIVIENRGDSPVQNQTVVISSKYEDFDQGVLGFQNDVVPGKIGFDTTMGVESGRLTIKYNLLGAGEVHRFWVIKDRYATLDFSIRNADVKVQGWNAKIYSKPDPNFWTLELLFFSILVFLMGMIGAALLDYKQITKAFERQGLNYLDFMKRDKELKKNDQKAEE